MRKQERDPYVQLLIDFLKTILVSDLFYFLSINLIGAILEDEKSVLVISAVLMVVFYAYYFIAFYIMHARRSMDDYSLDMEDKYSFKDDLKAILAEDGKRLAILYGILSIIMQLLYLLPIRTPIPSLLLPVFPIYLLFAVPVLTAIIGWGIATAGSILVIAYSHRRVHTLKAKGKL